MTSCSSAQINSAETKPPSWPTSSSSALVARASTMSDEIPATSLSVRWRPKR